MSKFESTESPDSRAMLHANAVLTELVSLHPVCLTTSELILRMTGGKHDAEQIATKDSIYELKRDGLVRQTGDVLEPTYAALCAAEIFDVL